EVAAVLERHDVPRLRREYLRLAARAETTQGPDGLARAKVLLEQLVALSPVGPGPGRAGLASAWVELARVRRDLGDEEGAEDGVRRALAEDPTSQPALRLRGDLALARRRWKEAEEAFTAALPSPGTEP